MGKRNGKKGFRNTQKEKIIENGPTRRKEEGVVRGRSREKPKLNEKVDDKKKIGQEPCQPIGGKKRKVNGEEWRTRREGDNTRYQTPKKKENKGENDQRERKWGGFAKGSEGKKKQGEAPCKNL